MYSATARLCRSFAAVDSTVPVHVKLTATARDHVVETPRTAASASSHEIPLVGMRAESTYTIDATLYDESGEMVSEVAGAAEFTTGSLPAWLGDHQLTIDAERAAPGSDPDSPPILR